MIDEKILQEHHKICKTCWSGQDKVVGRRCSACINYSEYEPINKIKNENMVRK